MFDISQCDLPQKLQNADKLLKELITRNQMLDQHTKELLNELKVSPEQLTTFISDENAFTPENWQTLQEEKRKLEEKLSTELKNIRNPLKIKKTLSEQRSNQTWLFVK